MDQLADYADDRLVNGCIYCGGREGTRDHSPSRVFLDSPLPENLPIVWACDPCNKGFSQDEEYLACLIECVIAGTTDPAAMRRARVTAILNHTPALRSKIEQARITKDGLVHFNVEADRIKNVILKLARGHAAFELSRVCREEPDSIWWGPLATMASGERDDFDGCHVTHLLGEIGSRASRRAMVTQVRLQSQSDENASMGLVIYDWIDVQDERYRYLAVDDTGGISVKIVIGEYLACKVIWHVAL